MKMKMIWKMVVIWAMMTQRMSGFDTLTDLNEYLTVLEA